MAKFIVEIDKSKGCKECPYCKNFDISYLHSGFYCTKITPKNKKLADAFYSDKIEVPEWCPLEEYEENTPIKIDTLQFQHYANFPSTIKIRSQITFNPNYLKVVRDKDDLQDMIKHNIRHSIAETKEFQEAITYTRETSISNGNECIVGTIEIVQKNVDSKK